MMIVHLFQCKCMNMCAHVRVYGYELWVGGVLICVALVWVLVWCRDGYMGMGFAHASANVHH